MLTLNKFFLFASTLAITTNAVCQTPDSLYMIKLAKISGMPGGEYNDCWGYVAPNGEEFAIIGSLQAINVFNVTNPKNPVLTYQKIDGTTSIWRDFKTYQNYLYAVADQGNEGLEIVNMNNYNFSQSTSHFLRAHNIYIDVPNARLYVAGSNGNGTAGAPPSEGLIIYDLSQNPANPTMIKKINFDTLINTPSLNMYVHDVYVKDNIAYASHGNSGFYMWDVSDVNDIKHLGHLNPNSSWYNHSSWLHPNGTHALIAEETHGRPLAVFELVPQNDTFDINEVKRFNNPLENPIVNNIVHNPFFLGNGLYLAYYHDGIQVYDLTDPLNPIRIAYYDTYPQNTTYSSYYGAWGVYPYLPSGTIVASDINHGLFLLKMQLGKLEVSNENLWIQEAEKGLVLTDSAGVKMKINVNDIGEIVISPVSTVSGKNIIKNADLEIKTNNKGIVFTTPSNRYYLLTVNNSGQLITQEVLPPTNATKISSGDLYLDDKNKGFSLHANDGNKWRTTITQNGSLKSYRFSH
jgi:choice-of-anchor B domain-containing protein